MKNSIKTNLTENDILRIQLEQFRLYFSSTGVPAFKLNDLSSGQIVYCSSEIINHTLAGLISQTNKCLDLECGLQPQQKIVCSSHIIIEPRIEYAEKLLYLYPSKIILNSKTMNFLESCLDNSIDTVFLNNILWFRSNEDAKKLLNEVYRVCSNQVVIYHAGDARNVSSLNSHDIPRNQLKKLSSWSPNNFKAAISVVDAESYSSSCNTTNVSLNDYEFYSIINMQEKKKSTIYLISDYDNNVSFDCEYFMIVDIEYSEYSFPQNNLPKRNMIVAPLKLIAQLAHMPRNNLIKNVVNFEFLISYLDIFDDVIPVGTAAEIILARHRSGWN